MSAIDRIVGKMMSQSSMIVRIRTQRRQAVHTPAQPEIQFPPRIYPQRYENSCQRRCATYHPQACELEWIGGHLVDVEVDCSKIAIPIAWPSG
jgi:hypothetical protein